MKPTINNPEAKPFGY